MTHTTPLDIAFGVGLLVQVTKLSDFLLRDHQKRGLQERLKSAAEKLDAVNPLALADRLIGKGAPDLHAVVISALVIAVALWVLIQQAIYGDSSQYATTNSGVDQLVTYSILIISLGATFRVSAIRSRVRGFITWLFSCSSLRQFERRWLYSMLVGVLLWCGIDEVTRYTISICYSLNPYDDRAAMRVADATHLIANGIVATAAQPLSLLTMSGLFVLVGQAALMLASLFVKFVNAIVWRIVEYDKGAWAAITAIVTAILGGFDWYLHYKP